MTAVAVCPGMVDTEMMGWFRDNRARVAEESGGEEKWDALLTPAQGAAQPLYAALHPGLRSGGFWSDFEEDTYANPVTMDPALGAELWEYSEAAVREAAGEPALQLKGRL